MCKISVIIPCYNSGEYIENCLRSFEKQTFRDFEIIAVDDCSQDNTKAVILDYMKQTNLVIRLAENEENRGPSHSRANGIAQAAGTYVAFCDSDDWYEPDYLQLMYQKSQEEDADIVIADYYTVSTLGKKTEKKIGRPETIPAAEALTVNVDSMCVMVCKKALFVGLEFPDIRNGEDMAVIPALLSRANRIAFVEKCLYNYLYREGSASNHASEKVVDSIAQSFRYVENTISRDYRDEIEYIGIRNLVYGALLSFFKYSKDNRRADEILDEFREKYPNWQKNPYLNRLPVYKRVFVMAANGKHYFLLRLLAKLHTKLAG